MKPKIINSDCLAAMRKMPDSSIDAIVTDPPYGLRFMGKKWDYEVPSVEIWREALRVLKPGGHLVSFAGSRTQHRMAVNVEDAGFELRDCLMWIYGSGFPKSLDVSKAIDKQDASDMRRARQLQFTEWMRSTGLSSSQIDMITGTNMGGHYVTAASQPAVATREYFEMLRPFFSVDVPGWIEQMVDERTVESENYKQRPPAEYAGRPGMAESWTDGAGWNGKHARGGSGITEAALKWEGWGTALKPAYEPIILARKPLAGTVAENVLQHGTGAINVDGCRIEGRERTEYGLTNSGRSAGNTYGEPSTSADFDASKGRWPANVCHDGSDEVLEGFPDSKAGVQRRPRGTGGTWSGESNEPCGPQYGDSGSAARFFYCAKASRADRDEGLDHLQPRTAGECTDRDDGTDGLNSPCAGAGRTGGARNFHPTVKPTELMRWLCRLITPPGGVILDPFMGSGSTGRAAVLEGFQFIGCEMSSEYCEIAIGRISAAMRSVEE